MPPAENIRKYPFRKQLRLKDYDYSACGYYFVSVCVKDKACLLGRVENDEMILNECGEVVRAVWLRIPQRFSGVELNAFIVMPNHFHAIVAIEDRVIFTALSYDEAGLLSPLNNASKGDPRSPLRSLARPVAGSPRPDRSVNLPVGAGSPRPLRFVTLGNVIGYFKHQSAKRINVLRGREGEPLWQRGYYDHVIRNDADHLRVLDYIDNNPLDWALDEENPERVVLPGVIRDGHPEGAPTDGTLS